MSRIGERERKELADRFGERVRFDEPLAPFTSWKIGGPADALVSIESTDDVAFVLRLCVRRGIAWFVLGSGSHLRGGDGGIRGIVPRWGGEFAALAGDATSEAGTVIVRAGA